MNEPKARIEDIAKPGEYEEGQEVGLVIKAETDLGYKAVVNGKHWGVLYYADVFRRLYKNEEVKGYIQKIREDGKLDLTLDNPRLVRHEKAADIGPQILEMLEDNHGFLNITDKTPADDIYDMFGVSKKKYKIALGGLYKKRLITIDDDGIRLVKKKI